MAALPAKPEDRPGSPPGRLRCGRASHRHHLLTGSSHNRYSRQRTPASVFTPEAKIPRRAREGTGSVPGGERSGAGSGGTSRRPVPHIRPDHRSPPRLRPCSRPCHAVEAAGPASRQGRARWPARAARMKVSGPGVASASVALPHPRPCGAHPGTQQGSSFPRCRVTQRSRIHASGAVRPHFASRKRRAISDSTADGGMILASRAYHLPLPTR